MKFTVLALAGLAAAIPTPEITSPHIPARTDGMVDIPHRPGSPYVSSVYNCEFIGPNFSVCNIDQTMTVCDSESVGTVWDCVDGCTPDFPEDGGPASPICKDPFNSDTWKFEEDGSFYHYPPYW